MRKYLASPFVLVPLFIASSAPAAPSTTLVISEFRARGPNGANDEFVEVLNKSTGPINLGLYRLASSDSAGNVTVLVRLAGTLNPGQFYLVAPPGSAFSGAATVTPDRRFAAGTSIPDNGGVALINNANAPLDAAGMNAGSAFVEGTPLAVRAGNVNQSYERQSGGCTATQDTDDNATDFRYNGSASSPQNTASICNPCDGVTCASPPNGQCWLSPGACVAGTCIYPQRTTGAGCNADLNNCTFPDTCDSAGVCLPGATPTCGAPPRAVCSDPDTLLTYSLPGACVAPGGCQFVQTSTDCQYGCNGTTRACNPNPCTGQVCNTPPNGCYTAVGANCVAGSCVYPLNPAGTSCSDGDACTTGDQCNAAGACQSGATVDPDDSNPCTVDACNSNTGTVTNLAEPNGTDCDDGNRCNGLASCQTGACVNGAAVACDLPPSSGCTEAGGTCNPSTGACTYDPLTAGASCGDGNACTSPDECDGNGLCNGAAVVCTPPGPTCVGTASRTSSGGVCGAGTCSYTETDTPCSFGCNAASGLCNNDPCIGVSCTTPTSQCHVNPGTCADGTCSYALSGLGTACDDADPCTSADECSAAGACAGTPLLCNIPPLPSCSGSSSTQYAVTGTCAAGECDYAPTSVACTFGCDGITGLCNNDPCIGVSCTTPTSQCHQDTGTCAAGTCSYELKPAGSTCDDATPCTEVDVCAADGACAGAPKVCNAPPLAACDGNTSSTFDAAGTCEPATGICRYTETETPCTSGCDPGTGRCNGDPCATVTCNVSQGACFQGTGTCANGTCSYDPQPAGIPCDDGNTCTETDVCNGVGVCVGTTITSCVVDGGAPPLDGGADGSVDGAVSLPDGAVVLPDGGAGGSVTGNGGSATGTGGSVTGNGGSATGAGGRRGSGGNGVEPDGGVDGGDGNPKSKDDGGCGCSVPGETRSTPWSLAFAAVLAFVARRRRARG